MKAPVFSPMIISRNSQDDSSRRALLSDNAYAMDEYKWDSRWKTQFAPSARRANFLVSFCASDTLKQRRFECHVVSSNFNTSWRYFSGMETIILSVSIMRPRIICQGPMINSDHLSIANGHCLTNSLGSPMTTKIASIIAASTIFICSTHITSITASST